MLNFFKTEHTSHSSTVLFLGIQNCIPHNGIPLLFTLTFKYDDNLLHLLCQISLRQNTRHILVQFYLFCLHTKTFPDSGALSLIYISSYPMCCIFLDKNCLFSATDTIVWRSINQVVGKLLRTVVLLHLTTYNRNRALDPIAFLPNLCQLCIAENTLHSDVKW